MKPHYQHHHHESLPIRPVWLQKTTLPTLLPKKNQRTREKFETAWLEDVRKNTAVSDKTSNETPPKTNKRDSSLRKKRNEGLLRLLVEKEEVRSNTSNKNFTNSKNDSRESGVPEEKSIAPTEKSGNLGLGDIKNLTFFRDFQLYQKKIPANYFFVLDLFFPPTSSISIINAKGIVVNRNCLNYNLNRTIHTQRD